MKKTEEKKTKQKNWFKECFLERRFFVLVLGALLGIALFLFVKEYDLLSKVFFYSEETTENIEKKRFITNLLPVILGLPIILFLWVFRTHDTKEQLDKAQTNIEQQDFHDALRMLADDKLISQEIAVLRLIDISKKNKIYNDTIKFAFIKRMKAPYETEEVKEVEREIEKYKKDKFIKAEHNLQIKKKLIKVRRRTYAQYIFRWLGERYRVEDKLDLVNLDLSYQDFRARDNDGKKIKHFKAKNGNYFVLDFVNLTGADLRDVNLTEINFSVANLIGSCFIRTVLTKATLGGVQLNFADLSGATLEKTDFANAKNILADKIIREPTTVLPAINNRIKECSNGADLSGANLTGAYLIETILIGVKNLTYEQLISAHAVQKVKGLKSILTKKELNKLEKDFKNRAKKKKN